MCIRDRLELGSLFGLDGHKLWNEYLSYQSFAKSLPDASLTCAILTMYNPASKDGMVTDFRSVGKDCSANIIQCSGGMFILHQEKSQNCPPESSEN